VALRCLQHCSRPPPGPAPSARQIHAGGSMATAPAPRRLQQATSSPSAALVVHLLGCRCLTRKELKPERQQRECRPAAEVSTASGQRRKTRWRSWRSRAEPHFCGSFPTESLQRAEIQGLHCGSRSRARVWEGSSRSRFWSRCWSPAKQGLNHWWLMPSK